MIGIHTQRNVAFVQDVDTWRESFGVREEPRKTMSERQSSAAQLKTAVTLVISVGGPQPARISFVDLLPKSVSYCDAFSSAHSCSIAPLQE